MKVIFFGTPQFATPTLQRLLAEPDMEVLAVVTQPDKRRGRGNQLTPSPVKAIATEYHVPVWQPNRVKKDEGTLEKLSATEADAFVVVAYGQILSQEILDMPRLGCINAHGSILPRYRGAAPIQWSLYHGEAETGITTMLMDAGMDTGAMLQKAVTPVGFLQNAWEVAEILSKIAADLVVDTLRQLDKQTVEPIPQDDAQATYAPLIKKQDYELDWSRSAIALHNQIRGFFPNCFTTFRGSSLKILAALPLGGSHPSLLPGEFQALEQDCAPIQQQLAKAPVSPGTVVGLLKNHGALVQTGDGLLLLRDVQMAGRRSQSGWDFVNGTRLEIGEALAMSQVPS